MSDIYYYLIPIAFILAVMAMYWRGKRRRYAAAAEVLDEAIKSGLTEPPSLHPVIDPTICCGSGACVAACPERALGIINHKAVLVNPAHCIGHGACAPACPVGAIKLVFGTEKRGIDIPQVKPTFETNVPGIYIAGELGGMGLVRKAAEQGRQAMDSIARNRGHGKQLDVVIVGAGPAGLAATLGAMEKKLRSVTLEQEDSLGGTVYHYPRNKLVMTQPVVLPIVGKAKLGEITKEDLLAFWHGIVERTGMKLNFDEQVEKVTATEGGYLVKSRKAEYFTRNVLLAIGRRGTPRKLGVPGEESAKVVYRLIDPEQYQGRKILVVGGGVRPRQAEEPRPARRGGARREADRAAVVERRPDRGAPCASRQGGRGDVRRERRRHRLRRRHPAHRHAQGNGHQGRDQVRHRVAGRTKAQKKAACEAAFSIGAAELVAREPRRVRPGTWRRRRGSPACPPCPSASRPGRLRRALR